MILLTFSEAQEKNTINEQTNQFRKRSAEKLQINVFEGTRFETEI